MVFILVVKIISTISKYPLEKASKTDEQRQKERSEFCFFTKTLSLYSS